VPLPPASRRADRAADLLLPRLATLAPPWPSDTAMAQLLGDGGMSALSAAAAAAAAAATAEEMPPTPRFAAAGCGPLPFGGPAASDASLRLREYIAGGTASLPLYSSGVPAAPSLRRGRSSFIVANSPGRLPVRSDEVAPLAGSRAPSRTAVRRGSASRAAPEPMATVSPLLRAALSRRGSSTARRPSLPLGGGSDAAAAAAAAAGAAAAAAAAAVASGDVPSMPLPPSAAGGDGGTANGEDGSGAAGAAAWPLPLRIPAVPRRAGDDVNPWWAAAAAADAAVDADLDVLLRLPWRVELWAEWEKVVHGGGASTSPGTSPTSPSHGTLSGGSSSSRTVGSAPPPPARQLMRMEIACDAVVDLSGLAAGEVRPRATGDAPPRPDGAIRAVCVDSQGQPQPFLLPAGAVVKAALYCGVHPVSLLGDIPATAGAASATATAPAALAVYDALEEAVLKLAAASELGDGLQLGGGGVAATSNGGVTNGGGDAARRRAGLRRGGSRGSASDEEAGDDSRSERSGGTIRRAVSVDSRRRTAASAGGSSTPGGGVLADLRALGVTTDTEAADPHALIDEAAWRLRRRNAAAVGSLALPVQRRHAGEWAADCGFIEMENPVRLRPRPGSLADVLAVHGGVGAGAGGVLTSRLPDFVGGGPDANTMAYASGLTATHAPAQAGAMMRAAADRYATWSTCAAPTEAAGGGEDGGSGGGVGGVSGIGGGGGGGGSVTLRSPSGSFATLLPALDGGAAGGSRLRGSGSEGAWPLPPRRVHVPTAVTAAAPGSPVRVSFLVAPSAGDASQPAVRLERVDIAFLLLPKAAAAAPLPPHLYTVLGRHAEGAALLQASGHLHALCDVAFCLSADKGAVADPATSADTAPLQRRAALLALGAAGATPRGYDAVRAVLPDVALRVDAAARGLRLQKRVIPAPAAAPGGAMMWYDAVSEADDTALRGTALQVVALLGSHAAGAHDFTVLGWCLHAPPPAGAAPASPATAAAVPVSLAALPQVPSAAYALRYTAGADSGVPPVVDPRLDDVAAGDTFLSASRLPPTDAPDWAAVLTRVGELASKVSQRDARTALLKLRVDKPDLFASSGLYMHVHAMLSRYTMALPIRRFLHNLFDRVSFSDAAWAAMA